MLAVAHLVIGLMSFGASLPAYLPPSSIARCATLAQLRNLDAFVLLNTLPSVTSYSSGLPPRSKAAISCIFALASMAAAQLVRVWV